MKKVLLILFVILVIIIGVAFGGYFVFKDEIDILQNEIENGTPFDAALTIIKLQGKDYIELNENTFVMKTNYFTDNVEKFIENKYDVVKMQAVDTMILFDAIIGNVDRHYGNVHILRSNYGDMIGAPILDNGASLLAQTNMLIGSIFGFRIGEWVNRSSTMERTHDKQVEYIKSLSGISYSVVPKTLQILNDIEPTLELMSPRRAKAVRKYVVYRLHKYLGLIKHADKNTVIPEKTVQAHDIIKELEHT